MEYIYIFKMTSEEPTIKESKPSIPEIQSEDIVKHKDLLSVPSKSRHGSPTKYLQHLISSPKKQKSIIGRGHSFSPIKLNGVLQNLNPSAPSSPTKSLSKSPLKIPHPPVITPDTLTDPAENVEINESSKTPIVPVKRKRGRPRKDDPTRPNLSSENGEPKPKRRPGRPRKEKSLTEEVPKVKRKRGRPRKEEVLARMELERQQENTGIDELELEVENEKKPVTKLIKLDVSTANILPKRSPRKRPSISSEKTEIKIQNSDSSDNEEDSVVEDNSLIEFNSEDEEDEDDVQESETSMIEDDDLVIVEKQEDIIIDSNTENKKPKRKRGRPRKIPNLEPETPKKLKSASIPNDFSYVSPLKKRILDNLQEYKTNSSLTQLKLDKNFVPAPLPTANYVPKPMTSTMNDFLDTFEGYFDQRKPIKRNVQRKRSKNSLSMAPEITREEFALISNTFSNLFLKAKRDKLLQLQKKMFAQYWFELTQGFTLLFYGVGSKREFIEKYAIEYLSPKLKQIQMYLNDEEDMDISTSANKKEFTGIPCIVVNGYNPTCSYRDVFKDITDIMFPEELSAGETKFWTNHVVLRIQKMIDFYATQPNDIKLILVVHNLDGPSVRKEQFQTMLSSLAIIRQIAIIASSDHIYAPMLWDSKKAQNYNFIFHDVSNYEPYVVESSFQDVMKMGKSDTRSGIEGVKYVLESLTTNSKKLFKLLVENQITKMESGDVNGKSEGTSAKKSRPVFGLEFKALSTRCANEFIASNDISLRTMLKEFIDHKMISATKNSGGSELLWVPYNYSELQKLKSTILADIK